MKFSEPPPFAGMRAKRRATTLLLAVAKHRDVEVRSRAVPIAVWLADQSMHLLELYVGRRLGELEPAGNQANRWPSDGPPPKRVRLRQRNAGSSAWLFTLAQHVERLP